MIQQILVKDVFETYSYLCIDEKTGHGFLIDPGAEAGRLLRMIREKGWTIEKILLTHGHFDHTGAVDEISKTLKIPYLIHQNGKSYLEDGRLNLSTLCRRNISLKEAEYVEEGDIISLQSNADFSLQVLHTPGHTPDSVIFYHTKEEAAFVGDTIFKGSIGTTEYPGGNIYQLQDSIIHKVFQLPPKTRLYSGHSQVTTVEDEMGRYIR